jgi:hypothetical protein
MNFLKKSFLFISLSASLMACSDKESVKAPLTIPTQYEGTSFAANASTELAVLGRLKAITDEAKKGRVSGIKVELNALNTLFTAGSPSLKSLNTPYYASRLEGSNGFLAELSKSSGTVYNPLAPITGEGGAYGGYLFDENGLEMEQLVEKGMFGSVLYKHATDLISQPLTPATVDRLLAILGSNPTFPNTSNASKVPAPDAMFAVYAARRDKNDGKGFYSQLKTQFIKLQAAIKAGDNYKTEQQEAIAAIKLTWEKVNAATIINYCSTVISTMSNTTTTDIQKANALHAYGECVGFIHGWRTIPMQHKKITDAQIDEILTLLNAPYNQIPTSYKFITSPVAELPKLQQVIKKLQDLYGFSAADLEDFKNNWITIQGR